MPEKNPYPWPKIANVATAVDNRVKGIIKSFDQAATLIATAWKHHRGRLHPDASTSTDLWMNVFRAFRGHRQAGRLHSSRGFHAYFASMPCVASQKYDGTNVGVTEDGLMLGRRMIIPADSDSYQSTSLEEVRDALSKVNVVKAELLSSLETQAADQSRCHCTLYGELMCNKRRFDYSERNLDSTFALFGLILRGSQRQDEGFSQLLSEKLCAQGFEVAASTNIDGIAEGETVDEAEIDPDAMEQFQIKLMMCPKLRALFTAHNLRVVAEAVRAPMVEVVRKLRPWMMDGEGEGVVLTIGSHSGDRGGLVKWKTATESQGSAPDVFGGAAQKLAARGQHPPPTAVDEQKQEEGVNAKSKRVQVIDPEIVELIHTMHAVSVSDCKGRSHKAVTARKQKKAAEPKVKVPPPISDEDIRAAYESALTKFDSLDHWFSSGGNVKSVSQTLFEEIAEDLGCISEDAKDTSKKKKKKKPINEASGGGAAGQSEGNGGGCGAAEHCEFARGTVRSFRKCGCSECTKQLAKQQFIKTYVMRQVGSAFGGWKVRAAGGGGL